MGVERFEISETQIPGPALKFRTHLKWTIRVDICTQECLGCTAVQMA